MMTIKEAGIYTVICAAVVTTCFILAMINIKNGIKREEAEMKLNLGIKIVINKDTLVITDYSVLESNYTLSNGIKLSKDAVIKLKP